MRSNGKATLGEALSAEMRARMARLRDDLVRRAEETIKAQLAQPKAPWQKIRPPVKAVAIAFSKPAPVKPRDAVLTRPASAASPRRATPGARPTLGRSSAAVPKAQPAPAFCYWELPPEAPVREEPPKTISAENLNAFEAFLRAGSTTSPSASGEEIFATIGLDFGTSTTKVIVRFPYEPGAPAIAIPAPAHCQSMGHPYLWQTVLWVADSGEFMATPHERAHLLHALKQGIMMRATDPVITLSAASGLGVMRMDAVAAFLALVVRYTRGWLFTQRGRLFRNRRPVWFLNVGMPVANIDDRPLVAAYRGAAAASMLLANLEGPLTIEQTRLFLAESHVVAAARSPAEAETLGIAVLPETAAEAAGFAKSTDRSPGLYLMVDVGAMTLDVCTFRLSERASATDRYALCAADVRPLGVEAYHWFLGFGKTEPQFVDQCDRCIRTVVWTTKTRKDPHADCWQTGNELPVFLAGGGANNALHRRIAESLNPWLRQHSQNGGTRILELPIPKNIDLPVAVSEFGRLAVAWGLSYPPNEIGEIFSPATIKDKPPPMAIDWTERYPGKELF